MRICIILPALFLPVFLWAQTPASGETDPGINAFEQAAEQETPDYTEAYRILQEEVQQHPDKASLHYYLGYTIDRMNSEDGKTLYLSDKMKCILSSEQFEKVNQLEPVYKGPFKILDPYSKISSIWGSLAMHYQYLQLPDSAVWAFQEGKRRGGFLEPVLDYCRNMLNSCDSSALLFTYGDNISFSTWYLQQVEQLRKDIAVVDVNLLHASWYPKLLKRGQQVDLSFSLEQLDTLGYLKWSPRIIQINNPRKPGQSMRWLLKPTYMNQFLLLGDRVMLDIIRRNFFKRPVYFNRHSDTSYNLSLSDYLRQEGLVDRVQWKKIDPLKDTLFPVKNPQLWKIRPPMRNDLKHSRDAVMVISGYRWACMDRLIELADRNEYKEAKKWGQFIQDYYPADLLPYSSSEEEEYISDMLKRLQVLQN